jgi:hypothetical protein
MCILLHFRSSTAITNRLQNSFKIKDNNVYGSSYYCNFRTSSFKQVAYLILLQGYWGRFNVLSMLLLKWSKIHMNSFDPKGVDIFLKVCFQVSLWILTEMIVIGNLKYLYI